MKSFEQYVDSFSDYYIYSPSLRGKETFLYPLQVGHFIYEAGYRQQRNSYDSFLLMYIQSGSLTVTLDGIDYEAHANQFVYIDCYKPHGYHSDTGWEAMWLHFDGLVARSYYEQIIEKTGNIFTLPYAVSCIKSLTNIYAMFSGSDSIHEPLISKYIVDILTSFMLYTAESPGQINSSSQISSVVSYISEHFSEDLTVSSLASLVALSPYHFIRVFRQETGFTPHEYLINTRMTAARFLLSSTSMTIKEICFQTGFSRESIFCTAFKKYNGVTPNEYRNTVSTKL